MTIRRYHFFALAIFAFVHLAGLAGGYALHQEMSKRSNATQLNDLAQQLMRRAEKAVDFVIIANSELLVTTQGTCDLQTRSKLRELVLDIGTVSDVYMVTETERCSSFGELSSTLPARAEWHQARNPIYRFGGIESDNTNFVGVSWGYGSDLELVSAINADALLFDILPNELRSTGRVELQIAQETIASFIGAEANEGADMASFATSGERYPFTVEIRVDQPTLAQWRSDIPAPIAISWIALCSFFAGLAAWASLRGRDDLLEDVKQALKRGDIVPHFQPIVDIGSGAAIGCEALARWIKPDGTTVSPGKFIPIIERYGLNGELLAAMVERAASGLRDKLATDPQFYVSFNVVPEQLTQHGFVADMTALVERHGLPTNQVCLEITERQMILSPEQVAETTKELAEKGFKIAIDDAGTGHNGLAALQVLDASTIKIDKFFVDHIGPDPQSRVLIDLFVSVARQYGMKTIAEGVETKEQVEVLQQANVDSIQGFYYARPMPADDFNSVIESLGREKTTTA